MNGIKYVLDTNALIAFFQGNPSLAFLNNSIRIGISIVTVLEFLSFKQLSNKDKDLFLKFLKNTIVIDLSANNEELLDSIIMIRKTFNVKLPDAIIAASSITNQAVLITNDTGFSKIALLEVLSY
jgi:predicted nucleic acid-binding protein